MESMKREIRSLKQEIIATIRQEPNTGEKKQIEAEDAEVQMQTSVNYKMEASTGVPEEIPEQPQAEEQVERSNERQAEVSEHLSEQVAEIQETEGIPATEIRETKETDGNSSMETSQEISERQGEPKAPNEQTTNEKVTEETDSKPRKRRVRSLAAVGAHRKEKKFKRSRKKWKLRKKTIHQKSSKEAFQKWLDHVRKKHRDQMNNVRHQTTRQQRHVPWDPGGFIYESGSSQVPEHRSQYDSSKPLPFTCCYKDPCARLVNR
jgi:hypothetical protein